MVVFNKRKIAVSIIAAMASAPAFADNSKDVMMVTTASGFQQKIEDAPASISVITRQQLEDKAYRDVTDALKDVPGVLVTGGGSSSDISIRGMDAKYTMILIDGKRVDTRSTRPNSDGSGIEQGWLPPLPAIERIEVVRGPMSSLYGSDAMGGVINIITRRVQQEWTTSLRADTTITERKNSGNTGQGSFYTSGPLIDGLLGVKLNGQYSHRGEDKIVDGFNRQIMASGGGTLSWTPDEKNTIDAEYKRDNQHRDDREGYSNKRGDGSGFSKYELTHMALTHTGIYDIASTDTYVQYDETKNPGRKMTAEDLVFRNQSVFLLGDHSLSLGGQYRKEKLKDEGNKFKQYNKLDRYSWALFAEDEWLMTNDFALTGGIRMDKDENYGSHWTPRLYGVWHADEQWTIKGGVTTGYKAPSLRESSANWGQATGGSRGCLLYTSEGDKPLDRIVGWQGDLRKLDPQTYAVYKDKFPQIDKIPLIGNTSADSVSAEKVLTLNPDIAIFGLSGHGPGKNSELVNQLEKAGVPVVFVDFRDNPLKNTLPSMRVLGKALNREQVAEKYADFYERNQKLVTDITSHIPEDKKPSVFIELRAGAFEDCCGTAGDGNMGNFIDLAGGKNIAKGVLPGALGTMNLEKIIAADPQIYIATGAKAPKSKDAGVQLGAQSTAEDAKASLKAITERKGIHSLSAVKDGKDYAIWHNYYNSPYNVLATQVFAKWFYPEQFAELDPQKTLNELHSQFLAVEPTGIYWVSEK